MKSLSTRRQTQHRTQRQTQRLDRLWIGLPLLVGTLLRLIGLDRQILGGDELHGVRLLLRRSVGQILTEYQDTDVCLPLTALSRWLMDRGVPLSEGLLRWPSVLSGIALIVVVPLLARQLFGRRAMFIFAWLAAISPPLVYFSRIARSYMPVAFWATVAIFAFWLWWTRGGLRWAGLYAVSVAVTIWMHLVSAPFVLAPFVWAAGRLVVDWVVDRRRDDGVEGPERGDGRSVGLAQIIVLGLATTGVIALVMLPAFASLLEVFGSKQGGGNLTWRVTGPVLRFLAGSGATLPAVGFWIAVLLGVFGLFRIKGLHRAEPSIMDRSPRIAGRGFLVYLLTLIGLQVLAVVLVEPFAVQVPLIFGRYILVAWPTVLCLAAFGLATAWRFGHVDRGTQDVRGSRWCGLASRALVFGVGLGLLLGYPFLGELGLRFGHLAGSDSMIRYYDEPMTIDERLIPEFYQRLGRDGDLAGEAGSIIVSPWSQAWWLGRAQVFFAPVHQRRVLAALPGAMASDPRAAWASFVTNNPESFLASSARWLVVHRDINAEFCGMSQPSKPGVPRSNMPAGPRENLAKVARETEARARREFGPPDFEETTVVVWDLDRLRVGG